MYFGKLVFEFDEQVFNLTEVKSKTISSHPGRDLVKSVLKKRNARVMVNHNHTHIYIAPLRGGFRGGAGEESTRRHKIGC